MSVIGSVIDLQNATAVQSAKDYIDSLNDKDGNRNVGQDMGKHDFLMLLSAQLRYQNPLEPSSDADFAAQLAQFSSLEQMQNMSMSLDTMSNYQSYSLVGKYVMAEANVGGKFEMISGVVDSIFVNKGITYAQIGEYVVPVSAISEVFDTNNLLTTEMFMQSANQLIGRTVIADLDGKEIEGIVTRVLVDKGSLLAQIDDGTDEPKFVPVNSIIDIREPGTVAFTPKPKYPPDALHFKEDPDSDGFIEYNSDLTLAIGRWDWDKDQWLWVYTSYTDAQGEGEEVADEAA